MTGIGKDAHNEDAMHAARVQSERPQFRRCAEVQSDM